jgi:hypothetical protein
VSEAQRPKQMELARNVYFISGLMETGIELVAPHIPQTPPDALSRCSALEPSDAGIGSRLVTPIARLHKAKFGLVR